MIDLAEHPFLMFCNQACIAPDTTRTDYELAVRWMRQTGGVITAAEVATMRANFWKAVNTAPSVSLGTIRL